MLKALKDRTQGTLLSLADSVGLLASISGASVVAFLGKAMLAVVLFALALGFFLRLSGRRNVRSESPAPQPVWVRPVAVVVAVVVVAVLVEATNLPVRFYQPGFEHWHWALVVLTLFITYFLTLRVIHAFIGRSRFTAQS